MAMDAQGNVYVGDRSNARVQVFDNDLNVKAIYDNVGNPWAVCISPGPHQYLFVSNSIPDNGLAQYRDITGEIYKMELDGTIVGKFGKAGQAARASSAPCTRSTAAIPTSCSSRKSPRGGSRRSCSGPQPRTSSGGDSSETHCALADDRRVALVAAARLSGQAPVPEIAFDSAPDFLKMPADIYLGEVAGVATNSKGHLFVYTRTGNPTVGLGNSRLFTHGGSRLFEFDRAASSCARSARASMRFLVAHAVRVDAQDNIWIVDEGSSQVDRSSVPTGAC